jgi:hypothetical protein
MDRHTLGMLKQLAESIQCEWTACSEPDCGNWDGLVRENGKLTNCKVCLGAGRVLVTSNRVMDL